MGSAMSDDGVVLRILDRVDAMEAELNDLSARLSEIEETTRKTDRLPTTDEQARVASRVDAMIKHEREGRRVLIQRAKSGDFKAELILGSVYGVRLVKGKATQPQEVPGAADTPSHRVSDRVSHTLSDRDGEQRAESREPEAETGRQPEKETP
jgi:hypothetical protein